MGEDFRSEAEAGAGARAGALGGLMFRFSSACTGDGGFSIAAAAAFRARGPGFLSHVLAGFGWGTEPPVYVLFGRGEKRTEGEDL